MIVFGTRLFGKVDKVPGLFHVATKFAHLNFLPLIPLEGWLVLEQSGNEWRGLKIPMSMKSVAVAWIRFLLGCAALAGIFIGALSLSDHREGGASMLVVGLLSLGALIGSYYWNWIAHADAERALELAVLAGMTDEGLDRLRVMSGLPVAARARVPRD